jgi:hypothetical protein
MGALQDRPDQSGVMLSINDLNGGTWIFIVEIKEGAVLSTGRNIIVEMVNKIDLPAIVVSFGKTPPHDTGDMVIVKDSLLPRSRRLIGQKLGILVEGIGLYDLKTVGKENDGSIDCI